MLLLRRFVSAASASIWMMSVTLMMAQPMGTDGPNDEALGKAWWAHVQYLADDSMKGRLTGSEEYLKAAAYVVEKFKSYGLQPAGVNGGFYQPVKFDVQRVIADKSSMGLVVDGKAEPLVLGRMRFWGRDRRRWGRWMLRWCLLGMDCICRKQSMTTLTRLRCRGRS